MLSSKREKQKNVSRMQYNGLNLNYGNYQSTAMTVEERIVEEESKKRIKELYVERIKRLL